MKTNRITLTVLAALALVLSGCGSATSSAGRFRTRNFTLTPETKLALGTLKLEGTPQAIDPALAAKLLPLWQLLAQLNSSDSSAPQEVQAVVDAIRATMNQAEVQSIDGMHLTGADIQSLFQGSGGQGTSEANRAGGAGFSAGQANGSGGSGFRGGQAGTTSSGGTRQNGGGQAFFFAGGGGPAGGEFLGGGFGGAGGTRTTTSSASGQSQAAAAQQARSAATALTGLLVNRVIQLLQSKLPS